MHDADSLARPRLSDSEEDSDEMGCSEEDKTQFKWLIYRLANLEVQKIARDIAKEHPRFSETSVKNLLVPLYESGLEEIADAIDDCDNEEELLDVVNNWPDYVFVPSQVNSPMGEN